VGGYTCFAPVAAGTFHVPNAVTLSLPAGTGSVQVGNNTPFSTFTATGLNFGYALGVTATSINATYN
jgi:hypothetical protein